MSQAVLEAVHLHKSFFEGSRKLKILRGANLTVSAGESIAIMGASGSGKSTLLHLLGGLEAPDEGRVLVSGEELGSLNTDQIATVRNRKLGFVYQFHHLLPEFSALENVAMPLLISGMPKTKAESSAREMLAAVELDQRRDHRPGQLSGGERQRVAIARALVTYPACVLMDEPTGNLDQQAAAQVIELSLRLNEQFGAALVIATHSHGVAAAMGQTQLLQAGQLQLETVKP